MSLDSIHIRPLLGDSGDLAPQPGTTTLVVNVASRCGLTPQYTGLVNLQKRFGSEKFTVLGVPCNQFGKQEPGTAEEITEFCSAQYGVDFPLTEKVDVNGEHRHPLYAWLTTHADASGHAGDIRWNFEKFLVGPSGEVVARFSPQTDPESPDVIAAIEAALEQG
jgi:glutathione peroxidase